MQSDPASTLPSCSSSHSFPRASNRPPLLMDRVSEAGDSRVCCSCGKVRVRCLSSSSITSLLFCSASLSLPSVLLPFSTLCNSFPSTTFSSCSSLLISSSSSLLDSCGFSLLSSRSFIVRLREEFPSLSSARALRYASTLSSSLALYSDNRSFIAFASALSFSNALR